MKIKLDENYELNSMGSGYSLDKKTVKEVKGENKEVLVNICYPSTVEYGLKRYCKEICESFEGTPEQYVKRIEEIMEPFKKLDF